MDALLSEFSSDFSHSDALALYLSMINGQSHGQDSILHFIHSAPASEHRPPKFVEVFL